MYGEFFVSQGSRDMFLDSKVVTNWEENTANQGTNPVKIPPAATIPRKSMENMISLKACAQTTSL